jgi:hypothetical protein
MQYGVSFPAVFHFSFSPPVSYDSYCPALAARWRGRWLRNCNLVSNIIRENLRDSERYFPDNDVIFLAMVSIILLVLAGANYLGRFFLMYMVPSQSSSAI